MTIRQKLVLCFVVLIGIFCLNFFIEQQLSKEVVTNSSYLSRSEEVIRNSNLLHKDMIDMQNSFRGYLLTGQESFLLPYNEGLQTVPSLLSSQKQLISSDMQQERLDSIQILHNEWLEYSQSLINAKKDTLPEAGLLYQQLFDSKLKMEAGKKINDLIRQLFIDFDRYEYRVRQDRRIALRESLERTRKISIALTIFSIAIAIVSCVLIISIIARRINKMAGLASDIAQGNFRQIDDNKNDEFRKLTESLNLMSDTLDRNITELTSKNQELDQFAYVVSHDLKAPLRGIDNITKWLEEDHQKDLSPAVSEMIELIKGRVKRLENLINGLLEYARVGKTKGDHTPVNVATMLDELISLLVPRSFSVKVGQNMPILITARLKLEQVFTNLISNAVKYNDKLAGEIYISCRNLGDFYEFTVADNGPGIEPEYHDKIFMIFQTLKERDAFESTGVGLAIVKKILDEQSATAKVTNGINGGTAFVFTWPKP